MTIGELSTACRVPATTIRYWERVGVLPPPVRTRAGHRQYGSQAVSDVAALQVAQTCGLRLRDAAVLMRERPTQALPVAAAKRLQALRRQMALLERAAACSCGSWVDCVAKLNG